MSTNPRVTIAVHYGDDLEERALGFEFTPSSLTGKQAEDLRPMLDFAIARLFMARNRCDALLELTSKERAKESQTGR